MRTSTGVLLQNETRHLIMLSQNTYSEVDRDTINENIAEGIILPIVRYCAPDISIWVYDVTPRFYSVSEAIALAKWFVGMKARAARWN